MIIVRSPHEAPRRSKSTVVALSGVSGAGKSALSAALELDPRARVLSSDDALDGDAWPDLWKPWLDSGKRLESLAATHLHAALDEVLAEDVGLVVLDAPFAPVQPALASLVDRSYFLDLPPEMALARRLGRYFAWGEDEERWPPSRVLRAVRADVHAYCQGDDASLMNAIREQVRPHCDVILDGRRSVEELRERIADDLEARR